MHFLLAFAAEEFLNFRELEVRSLLTLNGLKDDCIPDNVNWASPYVKIKCKDYAEAARLVERGVLIKSIFSIWKSSDTFEGLLEQVIDNIKDIYIYS